MQTLREILSQRQLHFAEELSESDIADIEAFYQQTARDRGGKLNEEELNAVISAYQNLDMIAAGADQTRSEKTEDAEKKEEETHAKLQTYDCFTKQPAADFPLMRIACRQNVLHGVFLSPDDDTYVFSSYDNQMQNDVMAIDSRFEKVLSYLVRSHVYCELKGIVQNNCLCVLSLHAWDPNHNMTLQSANDSFLQLVLQRLYTCDYQKDSEENEEQLQMVLSDLPAILDFLDCAENTLPAGIRSWAHRNVALIKTDTVPQEEKRHAQRALGLMLNIQWKGRKFDPIDPVAARRILDEELYGLDAVKQRVMETIIQINRTHTLPAYGLLLCGPAGTGKSQIAYAVARILGLPWTSLDMSTIHDAEALTGSPRVYSNAKPGRIMEAFEKAGSSNLVFIINELDKADQGKNGSNPADALLTLLDNLGFMDNYIECRVPTSGVYPIATANDKTRISDPLLTRFALIEIPDYTMKEKKIIFTDYSLPRVLKRIGMHREEIVITDEAVDAIIRKYEKMPGVRDLEQAAEHLCANALFRIETGHQKQIVFTKQLVEEVLA
ncbi:MAG: AAA family ATPase [Lactimicrobium massiliense]|nr:AAA family ATPase [Lactimicrobium massiliense]MDD6230705.1 AAA family ATPase [Lactimicrobium massiliense]MDD6726071.1 AAA family ATPase [Lactimicrobium massiliense]